MRTEFVNHYGSYMQITLGLMQAGFGSFESILDWNLEKYLYLGEMVVRRKIVENIK